MSILQPFLYSQSETKGPVPKVQATLIPFYTSYGNRTIKSIEYLLLGTSDNFPIDDITDGFAVIENSFHV